MRHEVIRSPIVNNKEVNKVKKRKTKHEREEIITEIKKISLKCRRKCVFR